MAGPRLCDQVGVTVAADVSAAGQEAVDDLVGYFAKPTGRLGYYGRLQAGRSIGSGAVEGLARYLGDRLKMPGRGWREDHLDPMATLVNLVQTPQWPDLWKPSANELPKSKATPFHEGCSSGIG